MGAYCAQPFAPSGRLNSTWPLPVLQPGSVDEHRPSQRDDEVVNEIGPLALVPRRIAAPDAVDMANEISCVRLSALSLDDKVDIVKTEFVR